MLTKFRVSHWGSHSIVHADEWSLTDGALLFYKLSPSEKREFVRGFSLAHTIYWEEV